MTTVEPPTTSATTSPATTTASPTVTTARTLIEPWGAPEDGLKVSVIVPDGWNIEDGYVVKGDEADGTLMAVIAGMVEHVYADRCQWTSTELDPPLGPTVDHLTTAFATIWGSGATAPVDVTVDSYAGKSMVMTVPDDVDFAECDEQHFVGWSDPENSGPSRWYQGAGQILRHWILDVDGERLLIEASHFPELSAEGLAELETVIESIQIET